MTAPATSLPGRIPTLDGWRGIAIMLVLFDHIQDAILHRYARSWTQTGQHGVTLFFVLSGFLITTRLLQSPLQSATLKRFYLRRAFRLLPVAWAFLAFMLLFDRLTHTHFLSVQEVLGCLFFYRNYLGVAGGGVAGHFWSLSLEEQFYLVWPVLLLLAGRRRCRWIAITGALACAACRLIFWAHYDRNLMNNHTEVRADALLIGCLLALLLTEPSLRSATLRWSSHLALPALAALLYCIARYPWLPPLTESLAIALLLAATAFHPRSFASRVLALPPLAWLGTISYSLYVWQSFFMLPWKAEIRPWLLCFLLPAFTLASYYCIERPATRLGHTIAHKLARPNKRRAADQPNQPGGPPNTGRNRCRTPLTAQQQ